MNCNMDCFNCPYADCENDTISLSEIAKIEEDNLRLLIEHTIVNRYDEQYWKYHKVYEKYERSAKGKERRERYERTEKAKERQEKYRQTDKGKQNNKRGCKTYYQTHREELLAKKAIYRENRKKEKSISTTNVG